MEQYRPHFVVKVDSSPEGLQRTEALRYLENTINVEPLSMLDALTVYDASLDTENQHKSIPDLMQEEKVHSSLDAVLSAYGLWENYFRSKLELYKSLEGFDETSESDIGTNDDVQDLIKWLRDNRNRDKTTTQEELRIQRMHIYIGRVALNRQSTGSVSEVA